MSLTAQAPWANGWSKWFVNDWQLSSLVTFHSGQPSDETRLGLDVIGNPFAGVSHKFSAAGGGTQWWNPAAFAKATSGAVCPQTQTTFCGNLARNKFYGPGYGTVDLSVFKNFQVHERLKLQLRAEMFNLFNRINLSQGSGAVGSTFGSGFGLVNDTAGDFFGAPGIGPGEPFNMQLGVKIIF